MKTKIKEYNGSGVAVQFLPKSEQDKNILSAFKSGKANNDIELTITYWVEQALLKEGYGEPSVLEFQRTQNNTYYIFKVQKIGSIGGH